MNWKWNCIRKWLGKELRWKLRWNLVCKMERDFLWLGWHLKCELWMKLVICEIEMNMDWDYIRVIDGTRYMGWNLMGYIWTGMVSIIIAWQTCKSNCFINLYLQSGQFIFNHFNKTKSNQNQTNLNRQF